MSDTNDIDNIVVEVVDDVVDDIVTGKLPRSVSIVNKCDDCDCNNVCEKEKNETKSNCVDDTEFNLDRVYFKHLLRYLYVSYLFANGFYKSLVHSLCPQYFKKDIIDILNKLQSKLCKKTD